MVEYFFGRNPDPDRPRIIIDNGERTVSRQHGTISPQGGGVYIVTDTDSAGGTFLREKGGWRRISTAKVQADDEVRLGKFVTSARQLMQLAKKNPPAPVDYQIERDPDTGEIIKRAK
jgi:predicted component of type VI protein secretion system